MVSSGRGREDGDMAGKDAAGPPAAAAGWLGSQCGPGAMVGIGDDRAQLAQSHGDRVGMGMGMVHPTLNSSPIS